MSSADPGPAACLLPRLEYKVLIAIGRAADTLNVAVLAVALFWVGTQFPSARAAARPESSPAPPFRVETTPVVLQPDHEVTAAFTGRLEAPRRTNLGLEAGCTLAEIMTDEGEAVPAGAVLARVDVRALQVDRAGLAAALCGKLLLRHGFSCAIRKSGFFSRRPDRDPKDRNITKIVFSITHDRKADVWRSTEKSAVFVALDTNHLQGGGPRSSVRG